MRISRVLMGLGCATVGLGCASQSPAPATSVCLTPAGNYKIEWKPESGNCPSELVKAMVEANTATSAKVSEVCYTKSASGSNNVTDTATGVTCAIAISGSMYGSSGGYGGTASVSVTCSDNSACQHGFQVVYTKQ